MNFKPFILLRSIALYLFFLFLAIFLCSSCSNGNKYKEDHKLSYSDDTDTIKPPPDIHSTQHSVDWFGTYTGLLPCADCEGIETKISLLKSGNYQKSSIYLGKDEKAFLETGQIDWSEDGSQITLQPKEGESQTFGVGEGHLRLLDENGSVIQGDLAAQYILEKTRTDERIEGKKWMLVELMGKSIDPKGKTKTAFLTLHVGDNRLSGNNGCNVFMGSYTLLGEGRIQFGKLGTSKMACPENVMDQARKFDKVLSKTDSYKVSNGQLTLSKGKMAVLAKFKPF